MGKEAVKTGEEFGVVKKTIQTPFRKPTMVAKLRSKIAIFLIDLAYKVSWDGYVTAISDGDFGYCPDCEQCRSDEPWYCR